MAKGAYIGVGSVARKVKKMYIGVGGVARKVKKVYIGVGGVARLCWSSGAPRLIISSATSSSTPYGKMCYTEDGTSFTLSTVNSFLIQDWAYGNNVYVVISSTNYVWYSADFGDTWVNTGVQGRYIQFFKGVFVLVRSVSTAAISYVNGVNIKTSTNGATWTQRVDWASSTCGSAQGIIVTNTAIRVTGNNTGGTFNYAAIAYSTNGTSWSTDNTSTTAGSARSLAEKHSFMRIPPPSGETWEENFIVSAGGLYYSSGTNLGGSTLIMSSSTQGMLCRGYGSYLYYLKYGNATQYSVYRINPIGSGTPTYTRCGTFYMSFLKQTAHSFGTLFGGDIETKGLDKLADDSTTKENVTTYPYDGTAYPDAVIGIENNGYNVG